MATSLATNMASTWLSSYFSHVAGKSDEVLGADLDDATGLPKVMWQSHNLGQNTTETS